MVLPLSFSVMIVLTCCNAHVPAPLQSERDRNNNAKYITDEITRGDSAYLYGTNVDDILEDTRHEAEGMVDARLLEGYSSTKRRKRVAKVISAAFMRGLRAVKRIVRSAKLISKNDAVTVFEKSGGYKQASLDFYSVKPNAVQNVGVHKRGLVGDRVISLEGGDRSRPATLLIQKPPDPDSDSGGPIIDIILYKDVTR